ncbi:MAG: hypothetical protein H7Y36_06780 [Armatimonadetes bacterium]|nr:hypothetical protein [Akkermansiaceae bacterium]
MKALYILALLFGVVSCDKPKSAPKQPDPTLSAELKASDTPILPIKKGDYWKYKVRVEIPAGVTSEGASAVDVDHQKTRTFIGKVTAGKGLPEVDAFDVVSAGQPIERELVEIHEDRVLMRGSTRPETADAKPMWIDPPIPFVIAGMRPGQEMANFSVKGSDRKRGMKVVAREKIKVPAGEFPVIRLLMTGNDGKFEIRRTTWFAPRIGIIKEVKARYASDKLLFRETVELFETNVK